MDIIGAFATRAILHLVGLFDESEFERKLSHTPPFGDDPAFDEDHPF